MKYSSEEIERCIAILESIGNSSQEYARLSEDQKIALLKAAGTISRPEREEKKKRAKERKKIAREMVVTKERLARASTGIRSARIDAVFKAPEQITFVDTNLSSVAAELESPRNCYVCKKEFTKLHVFYDTMCPDCADFNYQKRFQTAPLDGKVALITGSRVKIGYHATLKLLRAGAQVVATTRFPVDSAMRFSKEPDFKDWGMRLHIYGLDLRHTPSVELFTQFFEKKYDRLDILINNAAQTVRRPAGFYCHLMENELLSYDSLTPDVKLLLSDHEYCLQQLNAYGKLSIENESALPVSWDMKSPGMGLTSSARLSQIPYSYDHSLSVEKVFPEGQLDADLQQVDLRDVNSWRLKIGEIQTAEMLELHLVNAVAPFVLCNKLSPLMKKDCTGQKHIVNVSAMEGKFFRFKNNGRHPHTNMAKAALNMLTHTSAGDLADYGIYMNAVDTGWVTDEDPAHLVRFKQEKHDFQPPLDIVDGAARICDPFFHGILTGQHWCGKFLKDYFPIDW
jgi:NAD(P)-dependent dehydrogenase (short-subunit alcohol dehydrogenase family)